MEKTHKVAPDLWFDLGFWKNYTHLVLSLFPLCGEPLEVSKMLCDLLWYFKSCIEDSQERQDRCWGCRWRSAVTQGRLAGDGGTGRVEVVWSLKVEWVGSRIWKSIQSGSRLGTWKLPSLQKTPCWFWNQNKHNQEVNSKDLRSIPGRKSMRSIPKAKLSTNSGRAGPCVVLYII